MMVSFTRMQNLIGIARRMKEGYGDEFEKATKITIVLTGMPHGSGQHNKVEDGAVEMAEISRSYQEAFNTLAAMREELAPLIATLDDPDDVGIMRLRYIDGIRPEEIYPKVCLSRRAMFYHLTRAERTLIRMYPDKIVR